MNLRLWALRLLGFALALAFTVGAPTAPQQARAQAPQQAQPPQQAHAPAPAHAPPAPVPAPAPAPLAPRPLNFRGWAFDTCHAPTLATMRAWRTSRYRAVGVYYAGRGRACHRQPNLSRRWMSAVDAMGWRVLPIFVGSQSPCVLARNKKAVRMGRAPWRQGKREGAHAVRRAKAHGMDRGSALYLDMEAYDLRNSRCARTTLDFVRGWNRTVRHHGYVPGFYSSADSGVRHLERARKAGATDLPTVMWFARWHTAPSLYGERSLSPRAWHPHRRIHQYAGNATEKHGGRRISIDRNKVDAPVARIRR